MASKPRVSLSTIQGTPSLSSSFSSSTGFLPIRAPLTLDDDSSDFQSDGYKTDTSDSNTSSSGIDNGAEGFASGEDFETALERPFVGNPDEETLEESGFVDKYQGFRPFVADPDAESLENSVVEEDESGVTDDRGAVVGLDSPISNLVVPIAQVSMDDDDFDELVDDVRDVEDGRFSGTVQVPSFGVPEGVEGVPSVKVLFEEDKEEDLLVQKDSSVNGGSISGKFFGAENGALGSKVVDGSVYDSVSVELDDEEVCVFRPEARVESLVVSKEDVCNENLKLDEDVKHSVQETLPLESLKQEKIEVNYTDGFDAESMGYDNHEQSGVTQQGEHIAEIVNGSDDDTFGTVMNPVCETVETIVSNLQGLKVEVVGGEADEDKECQKKEHNVIKETVAFDSGSELVVRIEPETIARFELPVPEDATIVESADSAIGVNEIQTVDLLGNCDLPETSESVADEVNHASENLEKKGLLSDEDTEDIIFGGSGPTNHIMAKLERSLASSFSGAKVSHDHPQKFDGLVVTESDEEEDTAQEVKGNELLDSAALIALLKTASTAELDGSRVTVTSADGSKLFSLEHPPSSGSSSQTTGSVLQLDMLKNVVKGNLSEEEKKVIKIIQHLTVKFLRLVQRLGLSPEDSMVEKVLNRLVLHAGEQAGKELSLETAKRMAMQLEAEGKDNLDFSLNILVLGKTGVGKSATINSIFGEKKVMIDAFEPSTTRVKEIVGMVDGVRIRILDTPGLRSSLREEATNRKILASIKKFTKKFPPDIVLYVDRLDSHARDLNDLPLLSSITKFLTRSIWQNAIVTLTHAASPPPDGPSGSPLSFDVFVSQRSLVVQQAISQAVGDLRLMHPSMMHPVSLVENHPLCQKNENKENVLPNGHSWRPQLLLLCYSLKILLEASAILKPQDSFDRKKPFSLQLHSLPLAHLVSSLLQSRSSPKLASHQDGDNIDSDIELMALSDSDEEDDDEYDELPPFKPLRKSQVDKLSKEQRKAYFNEYDYRVKLLQKKHWREEVKRLEEIKKKGKDSWNGSSYNGDDVDQDDGCPAAVPVPMPDFVLPPSFDSDSPSYRYRILEPTSQLLVRPVLDSQGWDHDCGYDGISLERNLAIGGRFPGAFVAQFTKDKKEFNIHLDSSICAKRGENVSTMAGFDMQTYGRQLQYILRGETKLKHFKMNKISAGICITLLGENIASGLKIGNQIALGKRLTVVGSAGSVRSGGDAAYGANFEVRLKSKDFPLEQDQSTLGLALMKWRGDLDLMASLQSQFSVGRDSNIAIRVGMNRRRMGQLTVKTSSSELQIALISIVPIVLSIFRSIYPDCSPRNSDIPDY